MFKFFKKIYKPLFCFCLCFFSVFVLIGCSGGQTNDTSSGKKSGKRSSALHQEMAIGSEAPDFTAKLNNGETFTLSDKKGQVILLNFWATWCGPCREELSRVQKDIIDRFKGNEDFVFLPVSRGETRETVAAFREKMGYTFPMGLDPEQKIYRLYASNYIPRNFLIGKDGKVISATIGYEAPEFDELILLIERQLNSAN